MYTSHAAYKYIKMLKAILFRYGIWDDIAGYSNNHMHHERTKYEPVVLLVIMATCLVSFISIWTGIL